MRRLCRHEQGGSAHRWKTTMNQQGQNTDTNTSAAQDSESGVDVTSGVSAGDPGGADPMALIVNDADADQPA